MAQPKQITFGESARRQMEVGINLLADAVQTTLGPRGRNVLIERGYGGPMITKDGVTVARDVKLKDKLAALGADLVREVASKTNDVTGDGTTTATVLARAIIVEGGKHLVAGAAPIALRRGIEAALEQVVAHIKSKAVPVAGDDIERIASISANDPEIGKKIADMMREMGNDGIISVEDGKAIGINTEVVKGMRVDRGFLSSYMVTNPEKMETSLENVRVLVTADKIANAQELGEVMGMVAASGTRQLVVVCEDMLGDALATAVANIVRGNFQMLVLKAPGFGENKKELLQDIATLCGANLISEESGRMLNSVTVEDFGFAERVVATKDTTTFIGGRANEEALATRIGSVKALIESSEAKFDKERYTDRLAKLTGGIGVIRVGAPTEVDLKEKRHRVEDAVAATKAAVEEGVVPGGGKMLIDAARTLKEFPETLKGEAKFGASILLEAITKPARVIAENAGIEGSVIVGKLLETEDFNIGYNAETGEFEDLIKAGVIDPAKVTRIALENAVSVASLFLTTECVISNFPSEDDAKEV